MNGVTATVATPTMEVAGSVALIVVPPTATPVTRPLVGTVSETVALAGKSELHVTRSVRGAVVRSL